MKTGKGKYASGREEVKRVLEASPQQEAYRRLWGDVRQQAKTNVDFVRVLMEFSRNGALMQLFVMDALQKHADACASEEGQKQLRETMHEAFIHPDAWIRCAQEMKAALDVWLEPTKGAK